MTKRNLQQKTQGKAFRGGFNKGGQKGNGKKKMESRVVHKGKLKARPGLLPPLIRAIIQSHALRKAAFSAKGKNREGKEKISSR